MITQGRLSMDCDRPARRAHPTARPRTVTDRVAGMSNLDVDPWLDRQAVPVIEIARSVPGLTRGDLRRVERNGLVQHVGRARAGALTVSRDDALFLRHAAQIATAAGIGLVTVVRVLKAAQQHA